ncbi:hypothetical protein BKA65DRAFT_203188 [Rhexocercosporidium sp. MPI-PUGE-AT-0058]|nr:hypothetical protein BKA65DRAFT_203188 [Rhexocercosporidium sp. MPI-PUGE-AT-0058]
MPNEAAFPSDRDHRVHREERLERVGSPLRSLPRNVRTMRLYCAQTGDETFLSLSTNLNLTFKSSTFHSTSNASSIRRLPMKHCNPLSLFFFFFFPIIPKFTSSTSQISHLSALSTCTKEPAISTNSREEMGGRHWWSPDREGPTRSALEKPTTMPCISVPYQDGQTGIFRKSAHQISPSSLEENTVILSKGTIACTRNVS